MLMKNSIGLLCMLFSGAFIFSSCLGDDDDYDLYDDIAITYFELTYAELTLTTTSSEGEDSTYTDEYDDISYYPFSIDHINGLIYNEDSLPLNINAEKMLCTYSTKNNGYVLIENILGDSVELLTTTDTIDFRVSRYVQVYSSDYTAVRRYKITVNVRQEEEGQLKWKQYDDNSAFAAFTAINALKTTDKLLVIGYDGNTTQIYSSDIDDGNTWTLAGTEFAADLSHNVAARGDSLFILDGGALLASVDCGDSFETIAYLSGIDRLVGASTTEMHAIDSDGRVEVSYDGGLTWQKDSVGTDEDNYMTIQPENGVAYSASAFSESDSTDYVIMAVNGIESDSCVQMWRKLIEYSAGSEDSKWISLGVDDTYNFRLPKKDALSLFSYDGSLFAVTIGEIEETEEEEDDDDDDEEDDEDDEDDDEEEADTMRTKIYESRDGGITWKRGDEFAFTDAFDDTVIDIAGTSDGRGFAWFFCAGTGQIWRGYINGAEDVE